MKNLLALILAVFLVLLIYLLGSWMETAYELRHRNPLEPEYRFRPAWDTNLPLTPGVHTR